MNPLLKELAVVLVIAGAIFALCRPIWLSFMSEADYVRRRNTWFALTVTAFLSPSFWIYVPIAIVVVVWAARRDSNSSVLYLLLYFVIPPTYVYIPVVGIGQLFPLTEARLLGLVLLLPIAVGVFVGNPGGLGRRWTLVDTCLIGYVVLQIVLGFSYETITTTMRRSLLLFLDELLAYYVFSRVLASRERVEDAMSVFVLSSLLVAGFGIFESLKGWLLYEQMWPRWGSANLGAFLIRDGSLRAQASTGHSLLFGYVLSMALGMWMHLSTRVNGSWRRTAVTALLCAGIYLSHSRGPWFTAVVVYFVFLFLSPKGLSGLVRGSFVAILAGAVVAMTPVGSHIIDLLPFVGTVEQSNIAYRQQIATESWRLIMQKPFFGDPFVAGQMQDLKQGQGIIDLMNAYAAVALFTGLVGVGLVCSAFVGSAWRAWRASVATRATQPEVASMGAALVACMLGSLFFMATAGLDWIEYSLAGMLCAYAASVAIARVERSTRSAPMAHARTSFRNI